MKEPTSRRTDRGVVWCSDWIPRESLDPVAMKQFADDLVALLRGPNRVRVLPVDSDLDSFEGERDQA